MYVEIEYPKTENNADVILCQFCKRNEATESITDGETLQEVLICSSCENKMEWE
mgnify:CR=1 FL=1